MGDGSDADEFSTLLLNVAMKRKRFPGICSKLLSNTLNIEINNLKSATVELDSSRDSNATWCISNNLKEEIRKSVDGIKSLDALNKVEDVLQKTTRIKCVLDQIQKEKTCEMDIYLRGLAKTIDNVKTGNDTALSQT